MNKNGMTASAALHRSLAAVFGWALCTVPLAVLAQAPQPGDAANPAAAELLAVEGAASLLPRDLSPWGMFMAADWVVKSVMIGLAFASLLTWTVWLAKSLELRQGRHRAREAMAEIAGADSLATAVSRTVGMEGPVAQFAKAATMEVQSSAGIGKADGIKERVVSRLERIESAAGRRMALGTGLLATIGSTAPFVGLFGTVWGIMNSFIGISKAQTTNLAVVAPGIAEALLATALGLVAAIPAVVIYNGFARAIGGYKALLGDASAAVLRLVSRDLDRQTGHVSKAAAE